jgi:hypothetical protein
MALATVTVDAVPSLMRLQTLQLVAAFNLPLRASFDDAIIAVATV